MENDTQTTSVISTALRRSYRLNTIEITILGIGLWLLVGILGLFNPVAALSGRSMGAAYLVSAILILPTVLSHIELRQWIRASGGSYRLIQALDRPALTFMTGWLYLLGWAALNAFFAWVLAEQIQAFITTFTSYSVDTILIALASLAFFTLPNLLGWRPPWRLLVRFCGLLILIFVSAIPIILSRIETFARPAESFPSETNNIFLGVSILAVTFWIAEIVAERQPRNQIPRSTLTSALAAPLIAGALAALATLVIPAQPTLQALGEWLFPAYGALITSGISLVAIALLWPVLSLIMLRQFQNIGRDGVLPSGLMKINARMQTPNRLTITQAILTLIVLGIAFLLQSSDSVPILLAKIGGMMFILLQIPINLAAIILTRHPLAETRRFRIPLYPVIPACGIAIHFLLLLTLSGWSLFIGVIWLALGGLAFWQSGQDRMRSAQLGVTLFEGTRQTHITSDYPVLVPVANPDTAAGLVNIGAAIAQHHDGHLLLLQVIKVPEHIPLDAQRFEAQRQHDLMEELIRLAEEQRVKVTALTRLSRSISRGILDTMREESIKLTVMGSNLHPDSSSRTGFGAIVDQIFENAVCDVAVVSGDGDKTPRNVIVPVSGGPHAPKAAELALSITAHNNGTVTLLNIKRPADGESGLDAGRSFMEEIRASLSDPTRVDTRVERSSSVIDGILSASSDQDFILLGASIQGMFEEQPFGQLPLSVARKSKIPFLLFRSFSGMPSFVVRRAWRSVADVLPTLSTEERMGVSRKLREDARPNINYFTLITLSAVIATLGLLLNSAATVIGAMLVAPLMSPIVAIAMGIVSGDIRLLRQSIMATLQGALVGIFIAIFLTGVLPMDQPTSEVLMRTRPNLVDLLVALASGMAGAYAIGRKEVGEALPGVAIAAALLPPLASVGIGVAMGNGAIAGGALLLFTTNLIAIVFSSTLIFLLLGFRPPKRADRVHWLRQGILISIVSLVVISFPLGYLLWRAVDSDRVQNHARSIVEQSVDSWQATTLSDLSIHQEGSEVRIRGIIYSLHPISELEMQALENKLTQELNSEVTVQLFVIEGSLLESEP